ncbi:MAG: hypothetical protein OYH77_07525, partial [Pseudomonadota bacterium]|nr:hypothetical protein [Pseudomonadota bacterium]
DTVFTATQLTQTPNVIALAGAVFDIGEDKIFKAFAGKDMSIPLLHRMQDASGEETLASISANGLNNLQRRYFNAYCHELRRNFKLVGRMDYELDLEYRSPNIGDGEDLSHKSTSSRMMLQSAQQINKMLDHENLGFLSEQRGLVPTLQTTTLLPSYYEPWEQIANNMPKLYQSLYLRAELDEMPILTANKSKLEDRYLLRACSLLSMLAHAYHNARIYPPPDGIPDSITQPWQQVQQRLQRTQGVLSYIDLIVYNWKFADEESENFDISNLQLLFPTVNNQSERIFYLTQLEILARCAPIVTSIVKAQEAIVQNALPTLKQCLGHIIKRIQYIRQKSLLNIDPNVFSKTYVNPVVWAKTVAPFAVPFREGVLGPSGTSSPIFNVIDAFLERPQHKSFLGKEIYRLRSTYPIFWQNFIQAVEQVSLREYMKKANDPTLTALVNHLLEEYAGKDGFLGSHRMKVYGFLEIAFKVGRDVTIGGFSGKVMDKEHVHVDKQLEKSREERFRAQARNFHFAYIKHIGHTHSGGDTLTKHVVFDVAGLGIRYYPGYRCKILPEQEHELIVKTIAALGANENMQVELSAAWQAAVTLRFGYGKAKSLSLYNFLRFASIRTLSKQVAAHLLKFYPSPALRQAIASDHALEVHEAFDILRREGADLNKMLNTQPTDPAYIARALPPEDFRIYTISSSMQPFGNQDSADELHLTVGVLNYERQGQKRYGTASGFLARSVGRQEPVTIRIESPPHFNLPNDPQCPMLMIAGGTGVGVFRAFIAERLTSKQPCGEMVLIFFTQSREYFYYQEDFSHAVASGKLKLYVQFSREDLALDLSQGIKDGFKYQQSSAKRADKFFQEPANAELIWQFMQKEQKRIYICGRTSFAKAVQDAMLQTVEQHATGSPQKRKQFAVQTLGRMYAERSLMQETFTNITAQPQDKPIKLSQVAKKNQDELWLIIDEHVYDVTDFQHLHPGGHTILCSYAGMDASIGYNRAHDRPDVDVMRDIYRIGRLDLPDFAGDEQLQVIFKAWQEQLNEVVEMQNSLAVDLSFKDFNVIATFDARQQSLYKVEKILNTHNLFQTSYLVSLAETIIPELFAATGSLVGNNSGSDSVNYLLQDPKDNIDSVAILQEAMDELVVRVEDRKLKQRIADTLSDICRVDMDVLAKVKDNIIVGVELFEEHNSSVSSQHQRLMQLLFSTAMLLNQYWDKVANCFQTHGWSQDRYEQRR